MPSTTIKVVPWAEMVGVLIKSKEITELFINKFGNFGVFCGVSDKKWTVHQIVDIFYGRVSECPPNKTFF